MPSLSKRIFLLRGFIEPPKPEPLGHPSKLSKVLATRNISVYRLCQHAGFTRGAPFIYEAVRGEKGLQSGTILRIIIAINEISPEKPIAADDILE